MAFDRSLRRAACALLTAALLVPAWGGLARQVRAASQSEIDALKAEQAESQARQEELKEQLADVKEDQAAARQKRQILQQQLEAINAELDSINAQISYYDGEIAQKEAERREAEAKEQAQYERFCERVRAMEEEGTVSYWSILFNAEDFSDLLDRLADVDAVMDYDNQVMEELTAARQELERLQAELGERPRGGAGGQGAAGGQEGGAAGQGGAGPEAAGPDQRRCGGGQPAVGHRERGVGRHRGGHRPEAEGAGGAAEAEQRPAPAYRRRLAVAPACVQFEADLGLRLPDAPGGSRAKQPHRH